MHYPAFLSWLTSRLSITHQPKRLVENRPNPTENRPTLTEMRPDATEMRPNATLLRHFAYVANSGLRQIACDFLTSRIRVGEATKLQSIQRTDDATAPRCNTWIEIIVVLTYEPPGSSRRETPAHETPTGIKPVARKPRKPVAREGQRGRTAGRIRGSVTRRRSIASREWRVAGHALRSEDCKQHRTEE